MGQSCVHQACGTPADDEFLISIDAADVASDNFCFGSSTNCSSCIVKPSLALEGLSTSLQPGVASPVSDKTSSGMPSARLFVTGRPEEKGILIDVNSPTGIPFESEFMEGTLLFLQRPTPEPCDDNWPYAKHFRPSQRRWELRCQGRFKKHPGQMFFGAEMHGEVALTWSKQMLASWVLKVAKMLAAAKGVYFDHCFYLTELKNGDTIRPHYVSPINAAEALLSTPAGEKPPDITESIDWMPLVEKRKVEINTEDTFTIGLWNRQLDFSRWEIGPTGMPLGWTKGIKHFIGDQPVNLIAYGLKRDDLADDLHAESNKNIVLRLELSPSESHQVVAESNGPLQPFEDESSKALTKPELRRIDSCCPCCWRFLGRIF